MLVLVGVLFLSFAAFQQPASPDQSPPIQAPATLTGSQAPEAGTITIPAGTKVPLELKHAISTKTARPGDGVYLQTSFPVTLDNRMAIPPGTYVQGIIDSVKRPGKVKGRAEILFHFTTLIFPSGYTVSMPGAVNNVPGMVDSKMKDKEGTIQAEGTKGRDAATIGGTTATGTLIGLTRGARGAGIGAGVGAATGAIITLLSRGNDVRLEPGSTVEMIFQRPLVLDESKLYGNMSDASRASSAFENRSPSRSKPEDRIVLTPPPEPR